MEACDAVPRASVRRVVALVVAFACIGCSSGGNGGDVTASTAASPITSPPSELAPYCQAMVGFFIVLYDALSVIERTPPEQVAATAQSYVTTLQPLGAAGLAQAPEEIIGDVRNLTAAIDQMAVAGDASGFRSETVEASTARLYDFNFENCRWPMINLVAGGGPLGGVPQQLEPSFYVFQIRNDTSAALQVDLYRETPDLPDQPIEALLPAGTPVTPAGVTLEASTVVQPGGEASLPAIVDPGEYGFVLADPAASEGPVRVFDAGTVTSLRVAVSG